MRKPLTIIVAVLLLLVATAAGVWLFMGRNSSGWLCCITSPASGVEICVQVQGIDSECAGGEVGWCENISEDATGQADCLDR
jgi:hypothetical protein